jgi:hypothetical protein
MNQNNLEIDNIELKNIEFTIVKDIENVNITDKDNETIIDVKVNEINEMSTDFKVNEINE